MATEARPVRHDGRNMSTYPIGTRAPAFGGGHWYRTERGWMWNGPKGSGSTFPTPGGDWNGTVILPTVHKTAEISECTRYRYRLTRTWAEGGRLVAVMFNPSTADAEVDDPTVKLVTEIAQRNRYAGLTVVNMCPLRSPQPEQAQAMLEGAHTNRGANWDARKILWKNAEVIVEEVQAASAVLLAWGNLGSHAGEWMSALLTEIRDAAEGKPVYCLGKTALGHPKHPMARGKHKVLPTSPLIPWSFS